jgi:hypothetical protein
MKSAVVLYLLLTWARDVNADKGDGGHNEMKPQ